MCNYKYRIYLYGGIGLDPTDIRRGNDVPGSHVLLHAVGEAELFPGSPQR